MDEMETIGVDTAVETVEGQKEVKTYTEAELKSESDRRVTEALNTAKAKWEKEKLGYYKI